MLDELLPALDSLADDGALVILKWDGERTNNRCTVVITRQSTDYVFRQDTNNVTSAVVAGLMDYRAKHQN